MLNGANRYKVIVAICLLLVFLLDMLMPLGVAVGVLYVVAFYFATRASAKAIAIYAAASIFLVLFKLLFFIDAETGWMVYANRGLSAVAITVVAVFAIRRRKLADEIEWERETYIRILRQKNEKLHTYRRSLNLHLLMSVIDKDGLISYVNEPFSRISQYSQNELIGRSFFTAWQLTNDDKVEIQDAISEGATWRGEIKSRAKDGTAYWCDTVIFPIRDQADNATEFFSISMPITERKELEKRQAENLKAFEAILWRVSHKLRAPIATCMGITHLLQQQMPDFPDELEIKALQNRSSCTQELEQFSKEIIEIIQAKSPGKS